MLEAVSFLGIALPLWVLRQEIKTQPAHRLALSPFWYFTFLFVIAFPVRAYLINAKLVVVQALAAQQLSHPHSETMLTIALFFSLALWLAALFGWRQTLKIAQPQNIQLAHSSVSQPKWFRVVCGLAIFAVITIVALTIIGLKSQADFDGGIYQRARMGSGALWLLPEFFVYAALSMMGWLIVHKDRKLRWLEHALLITIIVFSSWISVALYSRRIVAAMVFAVIILHVARNLKLWPLALASIFSTVFAASILDFLRQLFFLSEKNNSFSSVSSVIEDIFFNHFLTLVSSAFEGVDHVARLMDKATWDQLTFGVDHGLSWIFNVGAGLIPRAIWTSKPINYGGMEQLHWLYPELFKDGFASASIPMSFAVDFSFAFGLPFAVVMAYVFGRLLGVAERSFWDQASHPAQVALSLFIFIYMFNWLRGGTIIVQSVMLFSIPAALIFGLRPVLHAALSLVGEAIGLVGGCWWGSQRVYFYPHAYLRDRQLDTIRGWAKDKAVNPDIVDQRLGAQVERDQAVAPARSSWKTTLPLINLKRRPKDAPKDAAAYVWGGLISKGPFITDIDNPYAFTGYNTLAVKLYRPIIQSFLESPRCLEIRCLSQACLDGVRREYGEAAAAKAIVTYPKVTAKVTNPRPQSAATCRFLFVSTQFEIKGGAALLNAFKRVVHEFPGAELDLVTHLPGGVDANIPNVRVHAADLTRDEIAERFLSTADVLVHPTYFDSFGMVVLEALAHGLPVIATDVYAIKEMVEDQNNGLLLEAPLSIWSGTKPSPLFSDTTKVRDLARITDTSKFEDALTKAMLKLAQDIEFRSKASAASLDLVRTKFTGTS